MGKRLVRVFKRRQVQRDYSMKYFVLRGTARHSQTEAGVQTSSIHAWVGMAFANDWKEALEAAHVKLKSVDLRTLTLDGNPIELPSHLANSATQQGKMMRESREQGAVVVISAEPRDPSDA